jgi:hypothetical protein
MDSVGIAVESARQLLARHPAGMSAMALRTELENQGYSSHTAQRAIQRALDARDAALGPLLELLLVPARNPAG